MKNKEEMKIKERIKGMNTADLREMAFRLNTDYRSGVEIVFDAILNELESRIDENSFIRFCSKLEV